MTEETQQTAEMPAPASAGAGRYSVADDGQIFFQENATNPLPGVAVGRIEKGAAMLAPKAVAEGHAAIQDWLDIHIRTVLEPLFKLMQVEGEGALTGAAQGIGERLYEHLGVMHRADLDDLITALDADLRKALRSKGVRLGPVLVFLPALVKPAAIKMRALLWALWNDKPLPVQKPLDGRVSEVVDTASIDRDFYRMIGYPVFGPRCIRIDMVDRVVTDIYDTAQQGVFEAKHKYAEWFGCSLDDLYAVLETMGHRRMKDEAGEAPKVEDVVADAVAVVEAPVVEEAAPAADVVVGDGVAPAPKAPAPAVKFMLKRGKMSDRPQAARPPRPERARRADKPAPAAEDGKAPEKKFTPKKRYDPNAPQRDKSRDDDRPRKPKFDRDKSRESQPKMYTFESKKTGDDDDSNPFAILKNLKK